MNWLTGCNYSIDWGNVPDWFLWISSAVLAVLALLHERRAKGLADADAELKRAEVEAVQARHVGIMVTTRRQLKDSTGGTVEIENDSGARITEVWVTVYLDPHDGSERQHFRAEPESRWRGTQPAIRAHNKESFEWDIPVSNPVEAFGTLDARVDFVDAAGVHWYREGDSQPCKKDHADPSY